jgi:V/A-type H+-transporting ATPase subunit A
VTQASLRVVGALWALDPSLAQRRQFPAVDWEVSYSLHAEGTAQGFAERGGPDMPALRHAVLGILQREREIEEIAGLVGRDALGDEDRLLLAVARIVRERVIGQNAFDAIDGCSSIAKTHALASLVVALHDAAKQALAAGASLEALPLEPAFASITAVRDAPGDALESRVSDARRAIDGFAHIRAETP